MTSLTGARQATNWRHPSRRGRRVASISSSPFAFIIAIAAVVVVAMAMAAAVAVVAAGAAPIFVESFEPPANPRSASSTSSSSWSSSSSLSSRSRTFVAIAAARRRSMSTVLRLSDDGGAGRTSASGEKPTIATGDTVFCKRSLPSLGIHENSSYEVTSIYVQYFDDETQRITRMPLGCLDDANVVASRRFGVGKNALYVTLYSPKYHAGGKGVGDVVVSPEEVGLTSVRDELVNATWLAVPGFFWVYVALSFYSTYHDKTGGSLADAFWGR
ncbi:hypothetical protein ACHAXA_007314 [Cyclostephanos tholiformis]|uniref:Uncharacterized protein n=1 Tax=Cyclostephanos tholiformis TaxID=382380 RepID=A0ABD3RVF0_9STRA